MANLKFVAEKNRVFVDNDNGVTLAEITFPEIEPGVVVIDHTFVAPELRGGGVASDLVEAAYDRIKSDGRRARVTCSYARSWFARNRGKRDILVDGL